MGSVRQETFPTVVREGESVTYQVAILPHDDPETNALREASRASSASTEIVEGESLPAQQRVLDESEMEWFMSSELGKGTFDQ